MEGGRPNPSSNEMEEDDDKEGRFLLGSPTFTDLDNGRLRCVETGHELPAKAKDSYAISKGCRRALIDDALSHSKPPLNMFKPSPLSNSKLLCNLTGDTINKSEEHIWKHINGKRFLNKLEQKEMEKKAGKRSESSKIVVVVEEEEEEVRKQEADGNGSSVGKEVTEEEETDFWVPPVGSRWDLDDGGDRWESRESPGHETDEDTSLGVDEKDDIESAELSMRRTKRMSIAVGPSSFASRKKKSKTLPSSANSL